MVNENIKKLVTYAVQNGLIEKSDIIYATNRLLEVLCLDEYTEPEKEYTDIDLDDVLENLTDFASENGLVGSGTTCRDLFDTKLMGAVTAPPSAVIKKFNEKYAISPVCATEFYYKFSSDTNYIRRSRIKKDLKWKYNSQYGELDITINLSKPEKNPQEIAAAKKMKQSGYPKCQLCAENEGYAGRLNHPARQNHRIIPITLNGEAWALQYSPYVYYNEHCIALNTKHVPMKIDRDAFLKLFDFVKMFSHYFIGSNADLPIVGGSILTHEHFQGGRYEFAMAKAPAEKTFTVPKFEDIDCCTVKWPMSVIRLRGKDTVRLADLADKILSAWRGYTDESCFIYAETDGEKHNTITPIARMRSDKFELDLVLRNNITTKEHPLGVFHPHAELHNIKKENIGLIEVMGLAVLPSRLKTEMNALCEHIINGEDIEKDELTEKHASWFAAFKDNYAFTKGNTMEILQKEIGATFEKVLEHAGVFKRTQEGQAGFERFISFLKAMD